MILVIPVDEPQFRVCMGKSVLYLGQVRVSYRLLEEEPVRPGREFNFHLPRGVPHPEVSRLQDDLFLPYREESANLLDYLPPPAGIPMPVPADGNQPRVFIIHSCTLSLLFLLSSRLSRTGQSRAYHVVLGASILLSRTG